MQDIITASALYLSTTGATIELNYMMILFAEPIFSCMLVYTLYSYLQIVSFVMYFFIALDDEDTSSSKNNKKIFKGSTCVCSTQMVLFIFPESFKRR